MQQGIFRSLSLLSPHVCHSARPETDILKENCGGGKNVCEGRAHAGAHTQSLIEHIWTFCAIYTQTHKLVFSRAVPLTEFQYEPNKNIKLIISFYVQ